MALNAKDLPSTRGGNKNPLDAGTYPSRLVAIIDVGLQNQRPFQGEDKPPAREIALTYELTDEFMKDEDGQELKDKPRWITEILPFHNLTSEKAKSTLRYKALDPVQKFEGDWSKLINSPVSVTIVLNPKKDRIYENVGGISAMRAKDAEKLPPLKNEPIVFDLDTPSMDLWKRIPKFLQDKIKANLEYAGSPLQKLLGNDPTPLKEEPRKVKETTEAEERPY